MDEIERELKQVQLQRERLALERELARKNALELTTKGVHAVTGAAAGTARQFISILRAFGRQWKLILLLAILIAGVMGALAWKERLQQERYEAEEATFVNKRCEHVGASPTCGKSDASVQDRFLCMQASSEEMSCRLGASAEFARMRGK